MKKNYCSKTFVFKKLKFQECLLALYMSLLSFILLPAATHAQQADRVPCSIKAEQESLAAIFESIEKQTGYAFLMMDQQGHILLGKKVDLDMPRSNLAAVLNKLKTATKLDFTIKEKKIIVKRISPVKNPGRIFGKIYDEKGEGLPGASIKILESGQHTQSSVDGSYQLQLDPGTYTLEVSYISFQTKRVSGIILKTAEQMSLNVVLPTSSAALKEVVVHSTFKKESVAGLYAQQKNNASVTDGISAEQIGRTADNNVASVLKRVSGITMLDNKYVIVRGLTERYNQAMIDGITMPNTDMNRRNFSFDLIPVELVSSVVVNKTARPDASAEFVGGQVTVNTLTIPDQNFASLSAGSTFNSQTTGKDFISAGGRSSKDYFTLYDKRRQMPDNLVSWSMGTGEDDPRVEGMTKGGFKTGYAGAIEQSKRFNSDAFRTYNSKAAPGQNYRLVIGRVYDLDKEARIGFTGAVTYRNIQQTNTFKSVRDWPVSLDYISKPDTMGTGVANLFNTTLGLVLNGGLQAKRFKLDFRNFYTRSFNEDFYRTMTKSQQGDFNIQNNFSDPFYSRIRQHKADVEYSVGQQGMKLEMGLAYTQLDQNHEDTRKFSYYGLDNTFGTYYQKPNVTTSNDIVDAYAWDYRLWTGIKEQDYNWSASLSQPFNFLKDKSLFKLGYTGWFKERKQEITIAKIYAKFMRMGGHNFTDPYSELLTPDRVGYGLNQAFYFLDNSNGGLFDANSKYHAFYAMLDQRFFDKLRLVYGLRAENFNLKNRQEAEIRRRKIREQQNPGTTYIDVLPILTGERNWNFLPSLNAIYSISKKTNLRFAYSKTMIRPDFRETSTFNFPDPLLQANVSGGNLSSTKIQNADLRLEYYPNPDELISVSGFYKYLDKPVELLNETPNANVVTLHYKNQHSAKNVGIEAEFRKSLGFIDDRLKSITLFGNGAWIYSEVKTIIKINNPDYNGADPNNTQPVLIDAIQPLKRPLIGQSPYIINAGILYQTKLGGATVSYNRSGYRSYTIAVNPANTEFQQPRSLLDLQLNARLFKQKAELKFNVSNLLDTEDVFYINGNSWESGAGVYKRIKGSDKYQPEDGDYIRYRSKYGRTYSLSFTYNF